MNHFKNSLPPPSLSCGTRSLSRLFPFKPPLASYLPSYYVQYSILTRHICCQQGPPFRKVTRSQKGNMKRSNAERRLAAEERLAQCANSPREPLLYTTLYSLHMEERKEGTCILFLPPPLVKSEIPSLPVSCLFATSNALLSFYVQYVSRFACLLLLCSYMRVFRSFTWPFILYPICLCLFSQTGVPTMYGTYALFTGGRG